MPFIKGGNDALVVANEAKEPNSLIIEHIPTGEARLLMASKIKLTGFKDALTTNFNKEAAYGRMDEIPFYQGTTRQIDLSIRLGPYYHYSSNEAQESKYNNNLFAEETLRDIMRFQYPTFIQRAGAGLRTIQSPPLLNIKFGQLISSDDKGPLICYLNGFTYSPLIDASPFSDKNVYVDGENMIPKQYDVNFNITVLHNYDLGTTVDEPPEILVTEGGLVSTPDLEALIDELSEEPPNQSNVPDSELDAAFPLE